MASTMTYVFIVIAICALYADTSALSISRSRRKAEICGVPKIKTGLIVRGQNFPRGSFPWIVALMDKRWEIPIFFCAGTLISKTFVISGNLFELIYSAVLIFQVSSCALHSSEAQYGEGVVAQKYACTVRCT